MSTPITCPTCRKTLRKVRDNYGHVAKLECKSYYCSYVHVIPLREQQAVNESIAIVDNVEIEIIDKKEIEECEYEEVARLLYERMNEFVDVKKTELDFRTLAVNKKLLSSFLRIKKYGDQKK